MNERGRGDRGFTLIELLVVIAVIGILVAMLLPVLTAVQERARKAAAAAMIKNLRQALSEYESDYGVYPGFDRALTLTDSKPLVVYLDGDTTNGGPKKLYMDFKDGDIIGGKLVDPWGNEYFYRVIRDNTTLATPPTAPDKKFKDNCPDPTASKYWNIHSFDLWSTGGAPGKICEYVTNF